MRNIGRVARRGVGAIAWYPCFFALAWALRLIADSNVDPVADYRSLMVIAVAAIGIAAATRLIVRNTPLAGALACLAVLALLKATTPAVVVLFVLAALLLALEFRLERRGRLKLPWPRIHEVLTILAAVMLALGIGDYASVLASRPSVGFDPAWAAQPSVDAALPNVYVVIADGHGRPDILRDAYGYDDTAFVDRLAALGFHVATDSRANYLNTELSLASFFSGSHLADLGFDMTQPPDPVRLSAVLRDNPAKRLLDRAGYQVIGIPSGYDHIAERDVDVDLDTGQPSELEYALLQSSAVGTWAQVPVEDIWLAAARDRTTASLAALDRVAADDSQPHAVFVHLPLPHPPYAFDATCGAIPVTLFTFQTIDPNGPEVPAGMQVLADQTRCIDTLLMNALATLVDADPSAVVILMSDHGPDVRYDWAAPHQPGLGDRVACLFAARTPGGELFPDDITLVNVLPRLFNRYLGTSLPTRPDDTYLGPTGSDAPLTRMEP